MNTNQTPPPSPLGSASCYASSCGRARLYLGNCLDLRNTVGQIDAIITDPPYGIDYQHSGGGKLEHLNRNLDKIMGDKNAFDPRPMLEKYEKDESKRGGAGAKMPIVIWGANHFSDKLPPGNWLCWDKACGMGPHSSFTDAEFAWTTRKTPRSVFHHLWMGLLRAGEDNSNATRRSHPSQKPVELMLWCLETARVGIGKTVFDPYMGSGSTGVAALRTGRKFVGCELDPKHFKTAVQRIESELSQGDLFLGHNSQAQTPNGSA